MLFHCKKNHRNSSGSDPCFYTLALAQSTESIFFKVQSADMNVICNILLYLVGLHAKIMRFRTLGPYFRAMVVPKNRGSGFTVNAYVQFHSGFQ